MPERVADAIDEIAGTNRGDQQEKPQIHAEPRLAATSTDPQYPGLSIAGRLPVRVGAAAVVGIIVGGLLA
jgi:hypothetical protein